MNTNSFNGADDENELDEGNSAGIPLGTGNLGADEAFDPLASSGRSRRIGAGALVLAVVIVGAVGGLYSMRTLSNVNAGEQFDTAIEQRIEGFLEKRGDDGRSEKASRLVAVLTEDRASSLVPLANVQRDPFRVFRTEVAPLVVELPSSPVATPEEIDARRRLVVRNLASRFKLSSTIVGSTPIAIIDGETVRLDDVLKIPNDEHEFRVTHIGRGAVELTVEHGDLVNGAEIVALAIRVGT